MSRFRLSMGFCLAVLAISLIFVGVQDPVPGAAAAAAPQANAQAIARVMQIQDRNTDRLMAVKGVVGTATGLDAAGQPVVKVFLAKGGVAGIPAKLEGVPVQVEVTGQFFALPKPATPPGQDKKKEEGGVDPTARFTRPVPIGVSTGNVGECSAGTIGCRVKDGSDNVYALSNNHVYALENNAPIGSGILQPGRYDTNCAIDPDDVIGTLHSSVDIDFDGGDNYIDAAIALCAESNLGNSTPPRPDGSADGYGTPNSINVPAEVGQAVQKYGRTTALTKGVVTGLNFTGDIGYSSGTARFKAQIVVSGHKFIKAGDSGSLLVTDDSDKNPVGLLFAGSASGKMAIASPIEWVLDAFDVTIDDEEESPAAP